MSNDQKERWAEAWEVADQYLSQERAQRLMSMSEEDAREEIKRIFSEPPPKRVERSTGLIEQQRLFRHLK